ncbi:unnamed protein product [Cylicocyclus nassatus]|uniref:Uncharacterized protein n=1 Tax=Cylicocyclus nassatus TaxID=53992 RepID=A0AA36MFK9_CYLNA|nr:unnamed protein product [Cylicocyclus nassatus]
MHVPFLDNPKLLCKVVPLSILVILFTALVVYVSWGLHIFNPTPLIIHMDCSIYEGARGKDNLEAYKQNRSVIRHQIDLNETKCSLIRKRRYLPVEIPDRMEVHHHMYFLRIVSKDYDFLEEVMTMMYSPLHFYCFVIDSNASPKFEQLVRILGQCILNIIVPPGKFNTTTANGTFAAYNACFNDMEGFPWKHTIITEENEMPIHSIHYIADNARRIQNAARIGRVTLSEEHIRILGDDLSKASEKDQDFIRRSLCTWFTTRRFPITLPRSFQPVLFKYMENQTLENCEPLSSAFDKEIALEACHTKRYDNRGNCIVGMEDYEDSIKSKYLFVRADPYFDDGIIQCVNAFVYRRTYKNGYGDIHYN